MCHEASRSDLNQLLFSRPHKQIYEHAMHLTATYGLTLHREALGVPQNLGLNDASHAMGLLVDELAGWSRQEGQQRP